MISIIDVSIKNLINKLFQIEIFRFLIVGLTIVFVDLIFYSLLIFYDFDTFLAKGLSFLVGTIFAYFANQKITFKATLNSNSSRYLFFSILYLSTLFINVSINESVLDITDRQIYSYALAFICATFVSSSINFVGMKFFVFNKKK